MLCFTFATADPQEPQVRRSQRMFWLCAVNTSHTLSAGLMDFECIQSASPIQRSRTSRGCTEENETVRGCCHEKLFKQSVCPFSTSVCAQHSLEANENHQWLPSSLSFIGVCLKDFSDLTVKTGLNLIASGQSKEIHYLFTKKNLNYFVITVCIRV